MEVKLNADERIDQLYRDNIQIIQSPSVFSFSLDAVLLANFAEVKQSSRAQIVDLCAGNGAVGLFYLKNKWTCDNGRNSVTFSGDGRAKYFT